MRQASAIVTVSDAYEKTLTATYPDLDRRRITLLPFGVSSADFTFASDHRPAQPLINFGDGNFHFVYTGRCGPNMSIAMSVIFRAFRRYLGSHPVSAQRMRFHFIGTDYAPPPAGREWAMPTAQAEGVAAYVHEHPSRVPYFDALHYLRRADALVVVGSNDSTYTASKLFPYVLTQRPLLVVFHRESLVMKFAQDLDLKFAHGFGAEADIPALVEAVYAQWFVGGGHRATPALNAMAIRPFMADTLTSRLAAVFASAVTGPVPIRSQSEHGNW